MRRRQPRLLLIGALAATLGGCVTYAPPVPEGYQGTVAIIKDSVKSHSASKADFFYVSEIDGRRIQDSRMKTLADNHGGGFTMIPTVLERNVPAKQATFTLVGRTEYAAPILALTNAVYEVTGKLTFSPENYKNYVVRGELGENYSAVWLEDEATGQPVGEKIEVKGSAKLGILEK